MNHLVHKTWTAYRDIMLRWWSNILEFDNANSEKEHTANPPKLKRRKTSASSSGYSTGMNGTGRTALTRVLRSQKRVQEKVTPTSTHGHPCTILSWLIDNKVVVSRARVKYIAKGSCPIKQGEVSREGIICDCCKKVFSLSDFESHAGCSETHGGCSSHRPAANIILENGKSLLECQIQLLSEKRKRSCRSQPHNRMKGNWPPENYSTCTVCREGGHLVLCDLCPSAFHQSCIGLKVGFLFLYLTSQLVNVRCFHVFLYISYWL